MTAGHSQATAIDQPINWPTRFVMLLGGLMITIAMSALTPVLPQIETALAHSADEKFLVKMLVPVIGVTMVIGAPLAGLLVDRMGLRRILAGFSLIYALSGTAGLYLSNLDALMASRLLVGLSAAGMATISMTLINTRLDGIDRARWMGFHISTAMFGSLLVHPVVGALGELGWRWPFSVYSLSLLLTIATVSGLQEPKRVSRSEARNAATGEERNPLKWFPLWFLPLALVMGSVTYLPNVYLGFVARQAGITSPSAIAMVMLADAVLGACMSLMFGRSQRYITSNAAFTFSFACTGLGMAIVALASGFIGIVGGMLVFGFGIGWFVPNLMTALSRRVTQGQQGRAVGIIKAAHYLASPLGILAVEPIARAFGPSGAMMTGSALSFGTVAVFLATRARGGRPRVAEIPLAAK